MAGASLALGAGAGGATLGTSAALGTVLMDGAIAACNWALDAAGTAAATGSEAVAAAGDRAGGAAQPVSPGDGGAPPTINTVVSTAYGKVRRRERRFTTGLEYPWELELGQKQRRYRAAASRLHRAGVRVQSPPRMASRLAVRSVPRIILAGTAAFGLLAGAPRSAFAQSAPAAAPVPATEAPEEEASPTRDQYPPPSARTNLVLAGAATTAVWYGLALSSSLLWPDTVGANDLRIPVAGPWMALSHSGCGNVSDCSQVIVVIRAIATTIDAIGQAGGLAIAAEGLFLPTQEPKRIRAALERPNASVEWRPTFDAGKNSLGLGVVGVF